MPPDENQDPGTEGAENQDGQQEQQLRDLSDLTGAAGAMARIYGRTDDEARAVEYFFDDLADADGLLDPQADGAITWLAEKAGQTILAQDLRDHQQAALEAQAVAQEQREKDERLDAKEALRRELAEQRTAEAAKAAEEAHRQELLAELDAEENPPTPTAEDGQLAVIEESLARVHDLSLDAETRYRAAEAGIEAARQLEKGEAPAPVDFDPDQFLAEFNASKEGK
jgi:hypothetical protein